MSQIKNIQGGQKTKAKKQILDNSSLEDEFFEDTLLIGIVSPLASYHFVWKMNQAYNFHFERNHEYEIEMNGVFFEVYSFHETEKLIEHVLYTNRKKTGFLLGEAKNIDFIWMIKGGYLSKEYTDLIPNLLHEINDVNSSFILNPKQLKSKQQLIL